MKFNKKIQLSKKIKKYSECKAILDTVKEELEAEKKKTAAETAIAETAIAERTAAELAKKRSRRKIA